MDTDKLQMILEPEQEKELLSALLGSQIADGPDILEGYADRDITKDKFKEILIDGIERSGIAKDVGLSPSGLAYSIMKHIENLTYTIKHGKNRIIF